MSVMYGQMAAKQAAAKIMAQAAAGRAGQVGQPGKKQNKYEYDSDEDTSEGKYAQYTSKQTDFYLHSFI